MKHNNAFYMQLTRRICDEEHVAKLSIGARMLYVTLNELEQRFCQEKQYFYRCDKDLANDMGVSINSLKKYKKELKENAQDLVKMGKGKKVYDNGKKSEKSFTTYQILK